MFPSSSLNCTYFLFQGEYYLQIHRVAMGAPVSPIVCNLYMESFEHWYIDDTHMVLKKIHTQEFTDHLNSVDDDIKWMIEGEVMTEALLHGSAMAGEGERLIRMERALTFLDTWMVVECDGSIILKVFKKDTHTDQYLYFSSSHPLEHRGDVRTLMNRAARLVNEETELGRESDHIR